MINAVLQSTELLTLNPEYVFINNDKVAQIAQQWAQEEFLAPDWSAPVFPDELTPQTVEFFLLGNALNFAFTDFKTKQKYVIEYQGVEWRGAYGMWASLKRALDNGIAILDASYLASMNESRATNLFAGLIPMLKERVEIMQEVGQVLNEEYSGRFYHVYEESNHRLFNERKGLVEQLTERFPSFDDSSFYDDELIVFDKRAQLAAAMLYSKYNNSGAFSVTDIDQLTIFADYVLPKGLYDLGILEYAPVLEDKIAHQQLIEKDSKEELEIRSATIHAGDRLLRKINKMRKQPINIAQLDYKLWSESRKKPGPHHLTITTAY